MIYSFLKRKADATELFSENVMSFRSYFVPCSGQNVCDSGSFYNIRAFSDRVFSLKGEADFAFLPDGDIAVIDSATFFNEKINIGESWESQDFCPLDYGNFSFYNKNFTIRESKNNKNSVGVYRRFFDVSDLSRSYYLSFLNVSGAFEVQVNGNYVGFSDLNRAEFDISQFLILGSNELIVKVKKLAESSYLANNMGFSASGIIGDVLLYICNPTSLYDYHFCSHSSDLGVCGELQLLFDKNAKADVYVVLKKDGKELFSQRKPIIEGGAGFSIDGDFDLYSADLPILYDLYIKVLENDGVTECTKVKIGFGNLEIIDGLTTFSGQPLKIYGVNYNGLYSKPGKLLNVEEIKKDLKLIKSYNFNAISPNYILDPMLLEVCAEIGLYVIQTIDINTKVMGFYPKKRDVIINCKKFAPIILDKTKSLFARDKSLCNIVLYSFGEENGNTLAISEAVKYIKANSHKPCIYRNCEKTDFDIATVFHPDINGLVDAINLVGASKPVFMSEYGISSGLGCASIREFIEVVDNTPCCLGGCITQFCDDNCDYIFANDNGLFNAERVPYAGAESNKYVCRKIHAFLPQVNMLELSNKSFFATTENITTELEVISNGKVLSKFRVEGKILPRSSRSFEIFLGHIEEDMYLNIYYKNKISKELHAKEQIPLNSSLNTISLEPINKPLAIMEIYDYLEIKFAGGYVRFNKITGTIVNYNLMGKELIKPTAGRNNEQSFVPNIYRPFVRNIKAKHSGMSLTPSTFTCEYDNNNIGNTISVEVENIFSKNKKDLFIIQDKYLISSNGVIEVFSVVTPMRRGIEAMDCFGKQIRLHNGFGLVTYYGRGFEENYIDVYKHSNMGLYSQSVDEACKKYALKQECGNHIDVHYAIVTDKEGDGIAIVAKQLPFQLRVSPNSDKEISEAYLKGQNEIAQSGVYVDINAFVSGIGNTVNGMPLAQYMIKPTEYILHFSIIPVYNKAKEAII